MMIDYKFLLQQANKGIIKKALQLVEDKCNLYISFRTNRQDVKLNKKLREKYPQAMAIILQHQFEDLQVSDNYFSVSLSFHGELENIKIPFSAISVFHDRDADFQLHLDDTLEDNTENDTDDKETITSFEEETDKVINISRFLNKD